MASGGAVGNVTRNVVPSFASLCTVIWPPRELTIP
jgi:hypothetical protein